MNKFLLPAIVVVVVAAGLGYYYSHRSSVPPNNLASYTNPASQLNPSQAGNRPGTETNFQATGNPDDIVKTLLDESTQSQTIVGQNDAQLQQEMNADGQTSINNVDGAYHDQEVQ